jgi:hypothetical protein
MTCHLPGVSYPLHMMNQHPAQETSYHDLEIPEACMACGGALATRFTAGAAHAVCRACRRISAMSLSKTEDGLQIVQTAAGLA